VGGIPGSPAFQFCLALEFARHVGAGVDGQSSMQDEKWKKIQETFHFALQQPAHERSPYLDSVCADDPELRREVDSFLHETSQIENFMEQPAAGLSLAEIV
jgi:hypothetical protein